MLSGLGGTGGGGPPPPPLQLAGLEVALGPDLRAIFPVVLNLGLSGTVGGRSAPGRTVWVCASHLTFWEPVPPRKRLLQTADHCCQWRRPMLPPLAWRPQCTCLIACAAMLHRCVATLRLGMPAGRCLRPGGPPTRSASGRHLARQRNAQSSGNAGKAIAPARRVVNNCCLPPCLATRWAWTDSLRPRFTRHMQ